MDLRDVIQQYLHENRRVTSTGGYCTFLIDGDAIIEL